MLMLLRSVHALFRHYSVLGKLGHQYVIAGQTLPPSGYPRCRLGVEGIACEIDHSSCEIMSRIGLAVEPVWNA